MRKNNGFTLIELLVVIAIIGLLSSIVLASLSTARKKGRDAKRLSDMKEIQTALEFYYDSNGNYPPNTDEEKGPGTRTWDAGSNGGPGSGDPFIQPLKDGGFLPTTPADPTATSADGGYAYFHYNAGENGCDASKGDYYVLGVRDMETSRRPYPSSPGWSCVRDWKLEFDWVTGRFRF